MFVRVQLFDENGRALKANSKQFDYDLFSVKDYSNDIKHKLIDYLAVKDCINLDTSRPDHREFLDLLCTSDNVELWDGRYKIVGREFRRMGLTYFRLTLKK